MTTTSEQFQVPQEKSTPVIPKHGSTILKTGAAVVFALGLALAPAPAFAQHGGGGGGGGGAHGGGGGGGSHGSFGGGGGSAPMSSGGSHANGGSASGNSNSAHSSSGGHSWNPFHSSSANSAAAAKGTNGIPAGNIKSESNATPVHFAAGNNTWQEPPHPATSAAGRVNYYGPANVNGSRPFVPITSSTRAPLGTVHSTAVVAAAQHPFQPYRPGYPYYPYNPFFGYYPYYGGFGFGWGGGYGPCNPFWGCAGYGFGFGYGFGGGLGYFGGGSGGYDTGWTDASAESSANVTSPDNVDSYLLAAPGTGGAQAADTSDASQTAAADSVQQQPYVLLYLKDGSSFAVSEYWLTEGKLHYFTSYGGENAIEESQIDLQRTVNENAARGVNFTLRPGPAKSGDAAAPAPVPEPEKLQK
jgi:hypothetical protein